MGDNRETWLLWDKETDEPESLIRGSTSSQEDYGGKMIMGYFSVRKHGIVV